MGYWFVGFQHLSTIKKIFVVSVVLLFLILTGVGGFWFGLAHVEKGVQRILSPIGTYISGKPAEPRNVPDPLDGVLYTKTEANIWKDRLPLAVVIENSVDARPQSGMNKAEITYEALAEGGITRTLNIFLAEDSAIGPIRSNRPYFLDWVSEYGAGYAHVGGSPEAQADLGPFGIKDLDQFGLGTLAYDRVNTRPAPHNVYTDTARLRSVAASKKGYTGPVSIDSWLFKDKEAAASDRPASFDLKISFGSGGFNDYAVEWKYDPKNNDYLRWNGGDPHIDATTNQQLFAKTIVVQSMVTVLAASDGHGRLHMTTIGSNAVKVFTDGKVFAGTWRKDSRTGRTRFYDDNGKEIPLNRGKIWVEVVPVGSPVTYQ